MKRLCAPLPRWIGSVPSQLAGATTPFVCGRFGFRSCRNTQVPEESQLVFQGPRAQVDCIAMFNETVFVSASDDG